MEVIIQRIPFVADQIFQQLNNKGLSNCKEVSKSWQKYIEDKSFSWIRIINVPKTQFGDYCIKNDALYIAAEIGQTKIFKMIFENEEDKNLRHDNNGMTPFQLACANGHFLIAKFFIEHSDELEIDLNGEENYDSGLQFK